MNPRVIPLVLIAILACPSVPTMVRGEIAPQSELRVPPEFDLANAMKSIYGNFDEAAKTSVFIVPEDFPHHFFEQGDRAVASAFFIAKGRDSGAEKMFLVIDAVLPMPTYFKCHACAPLIGAAVFVKSGGAWRIESSSTAILVDGNSGYPPDARLIEIGPQRMGIELKDTYVGQGSTTTFIAMLIPWHGEIRDAIEVIIGDDDLGECRKGVDCYKTRRQVRLVRGANPDYDDVVVTTSGTERDEKRGAVVRVRGVETWRFSEGKYLREGK